MNTMNTINAFEKSLRDFCERNNIEMGVDIVKNIPLGRKYVFLYKGNGFRRKNYDGNYIIVNFREVTDVYKTLNSTIDYLIDLYGLDDRPDPYVTPSDIVVERVSENPYFTQRFEIDSVAFYTSPEWHEERIKSTINTFFERYAAKEKDMKVKIEKVYFNEPYTIVIWSDKTKTMVKAENENYDPEKGLAMAICKKFLGTNKSQGNYFDEFKKWLPEDRKPVVKEVYLFASELAEKTGQSVSTVRKDCARGLYPGAKKVDGRWVIPYSGMAKGE